MVKVLLFILYIYNGDVKLEKSYYDTMEQCAKAGNARVEELDKDPRVDSVIVGGCMPSNAQEVNKWITPKQLSVVTCSF